MILINFLYQDIPSLGKADHFCAAPHFPDLWTIWIKYAHDCQLCAGPALFMHTLLGRGSKSQTKRRRWWGWECGQRHKQFQFSFVANWFVAARRGAWLSGRNRRPRVKIDRNPGIRQIHLSPQIQLAGQSKLWNAQTAQSLCRESTTLGLSPRVNSRYFHSYQT